MQAGEARKSLPALIQGTAPNKIESRATPAYSASPAGAEQCYF